MDEMDEIGINDLEDKEAIEYGFNSIDNIDEHPSLEEEIEGERARTQMREMNNIPIDQQDDEEIEDDDPFSGLPPSTSQHNGTYQGEDGVLYD